MHDRSAVSLSRATPPERPEFMRSVHRTIAVVALAAIGSAEAGEFPIYGTWPQPGGAGTPLTLTYSYAGLFGSLENANTGRPFDDAVLMAAFESALADYTTFLPIHFVEVVDSGPPIGTGEYDPTGHADIRIGQMESVGGANAYAYFPGDSASGLAGDIVFSRDAFNGWTEFLFYVVAQHELGHSLGMGHEVEGEQPSPQGPGLGYDGQRIPLNAGSITALSGAYGRGRGSVTPLSAVPLPAGGPILVVGLTTLASRRVVTRADR